MSQTVSRTVNNASTLLQTWTRILSLTEHNQRLILNPQWQGATQDLVDMQHDQVERKHAAERRAAEEQARREAAIRRAEAEKSKAEAAPRGGARGRARGGTSTRGRAGSTSASSSSARGLGRSASASSRGTSGIGRGTRGTGRGRGARLSVQSCSPKLQLIMR